jgi:hypothetical protein
MSVFFFLLSIGNSKTTPLGLTTPPLEQRTALLESGGVVLVLCEGGLQSGVVVFQFITTGL